MAHKILFLLIAFLSPLLTAMGADNRFTLVIDAGHGGYDSGAKGVNSYEKNLTLRYALAFGQAVERECPDVRVIYTRTKDVFLPLHERADIANRNKADLFISFHINALDRGRISHGFQSYTLGTGERTGMQGLKENLEVAKRENSVIFMEKDYKTNYKGLENSAESDIMFEFIADKNRERSVELSRLMQREVCKATGRVDGGSHQNNLAVLRLTSMPAILLELGFITTPNEENFLNTDSALDLYTQGIYNAFVNYKNRHDDNIDVPYRAPKADISLAIQETKARATVQPQTADEPATQKAQPAREKPQPSKETATVSKETSGVSKGKQLSVRERAELSKEKPQNTKEKPRQAKEKAQAEAKNSQAERKDAPVFKIQILSSKTKVDNDSRHFKGLKGCESYAEGSYIKYTYGSSTNYNEIYRLRKEVVEKFPEAFIVAFKNGQKINVSDGIKEFLANKKK